ncbi:helix-turn-helix domain-containing protein [Spirosoma spitsbergense]|uniref:helix-turn-helix domain-containing protein n=1 Tax=Spirosoma spitsbergense TaxID=431554 RepID=UPI0004780B8F|nr:helix-turn-helix transcriptional regulator [Spirosoma spitsbergense]
MSEITPEQIGEIIKQLRKERNLTQTELGEKMGVKKSSIALYEKGRDNISLSTLKRIASALNAELTINITLK